MIVQPAMVVHDLCPGGFFGEEGCTDSWPSCYNPVVDTAVTIEYACDDDVAFLTRHDPHAAVIPEKVSRGEVIVVRRDGAVVGWLRFGYFWDVIPFMNMLFLLEPHRRQGIGRRLVAFWEDQMRQQGHSRVMTSTQADEQAQCFYRRLGYVDIGRFTPPGETVVELLLCKSLA